MASNQPNGAGRQPGLFELSAPCRHPRSGESVGTSSRTKSGPSLGHIVRGLSLMIAVAWASMFAGPAGPLGLPHFGSHAAAQSLRPSTPSPLRPKQGGNNRSVAERSVAESARISRVSAEETVAEETVAGEPVAEEAVAEESVAEEASADGNLGPSNGRNGQLNAAVGDDSEADGAADGDMATGKSSVGGPIRLTPRSAARTYAPEKQIPRVFSASPADSRSAMRSPAAGSPSANSVLNTRDNQPAGEAPEVGDGPDSGAAEPLGNPRRSSSMPGNEAGPRFADAPELFSEPWAEPLDGRMGGWWVTGEYLMWWRKGIDLPAMASTGPLDDPGVSLLYGNQTVGGQARPGARLSFGWAGGPHQRQGWFARVYFLETGASDYSENRTDVPGLARPFFDLSGAQPELNAVTVDSLHVRTESDFVGGDILMRQMIHLSPLARVDFLLGYQFARIDETLRIDSTANNVFQLTDHFAAANEFHGGALGLQFIYDRPGVRLDMLAKVGLGSMQKEILLEGSSSSDPRAGLLVQASNRGRYSQSDFMALPEFGATMTWAVSPSIEFSLGYSLLYFPSVVQAASGIDSQLAVDLSPPANRPRFAFHDSDYWVHGLNLGLTWRY